MERQEVLTLAVEAGEILMSNGAETYRVEETMHHILGTAYGDNVGVFITTTGIMASVVADDGSPYAMIRSIKSGAINLEKVSRVNSLSRRYTAGEVPLEDAFAELEEIRKLGPYPLYVSIAAYATTCSAFSFILGGSLWDVGICGCIGILLCLFLQWLKKHVSSLFLIHILGGFLIGTLAAFSTLTGIGRDINAITVGGLMPMVPGVAMTNAIRDVLKGDYLSGSARAVEAIIIAVSIAVGVIGSLKLWPMLIDNMVI